MKVEMNWNPTERQLRQFGLISLAALPFLGWFWGLGITAVGILASLGAVSCLLGLLYPRSLKYPFIGLCLLSLPIGIVMGEVMMAVAFVTIFVPLALVFRWLGRDALERAWDPNTKSYWQPKAAAVDARSYLRQS